MLVNVAFNEKLCRQSPEVFIDELCRSLNPHYLVTGPNFSFGAKAKGNPRMLLRMGEEYGFQAEVGQAVQLDGRMVSSTRIRSLIEAGDLEKTNEYLGRYFSFGAGGFTEIIVVGNWAFLQPICLSDLIGPCCLMVLMLC